MLQEYVTKISKQIDQYRKMATNADAIVAALDACLEGDQNAMRMLQEFETMEGYVVCLIHLLVTTIPVTKADSGLLAMISLKNVVNRYWVARGATSSRFLTVEEKKIVKSFLLLQACATAPAMVLTDKRVAKQLAVILAKVARLEWPGDWQELLPTLFGAFQQAASQSVYISIAPSMHDRLLLPSLLAVINELSTKHIPAAKKAFAEAAMQMFPEFAKAWTQVTDQLASILLSEQHSTHTQLADRAFTLTKLLDTLVRKAFTDLHRAGVFAPFGECLIRKIVTYNAALSTAATIVQVPTDFFDSMGNDVASSSSSSEGDELDIEGVFQSVSGALSQTDFARVGPTIVLLVMCGHIAAKLSDLITSLQKEYPLHVVPYLEGFLSHAYGQLVKHIGTDVDGSGSDGGNGSSSGNGNAGSRCVRHRLHALFTTSSTISSVLLLSNVLASTAYSVEESVAKRKEKLQLRMSMAAAAGAGAGAGGARSGASQGPGADDDVESAAGLARTVKDAFFSPARVAELVLLLLRRGLSHSATELGSWVENPEQFFAHLESLREQDTLKAACEGLFLGLLDCSPELVGRDIIGSLLHDARRQSAAIAASVENPAGNTEEMCFWANVYLCVGLGPATLGQYTDMSAWVVAVAGPLLGQLLAHPRAGAVVHDGQVAQLLRARVVWMLGILSYTLEPPVKVQMFHLLLSMLDVQASGSDTVVLMQAIGALTQLLAMDGFDPGALLDTSSVVQLVSALCAVTAHHLEEEDTKERAVNLVITVLDGCGRRLVAREPALLSALTTHLSMIWENSSLSSPLRVTIIVVSGCRVVQSGVEWCRVV